jgi:hypothetical protein
MIHRLELSIVFIRSSFKKPEDKDQEQNQQNWNGNEAKVRVAICLGWTWRSGVLFLIIETGNYNRRAACSTIR